MAVSCGRARLGRKMPERGRLTGAFSEKTSTKRTFASVRTPVLNGRIYVIMKKYSVLGHAGVRIKIFIANSALYGKRSRYRGVRQHALEGKKNIYICFPIFFRRCTHKRHPLIAGAVNRMCPAKKLEVVRQLLVPRSDTADVVFETEST